jgi:hypothetical protein
MSALITAAAVAAVGIGAGVYESSQEHGIQEQQLGLANTQLGMQTQSFDQLQQLMANPSSFFQSPVYQAAANQGGQQVARQMAAGGFLNSGNEATALQAYGQTFGQQQLLSQEQLLAGMSGTGFNPASALSGASSTEGQTFNQTGTLLAALGQSGALSGYGFGGGGSNTVPGGSSGLMDLSGNQSGYIINTPY